MKGLLPISVHSACELCLQCVDWLEPTRVEGHRPGESGMGLWWAVADSGKRPSPRSTMDADSWTGLFIVYCMHTETLDSDEGGGSRQETNTQREVLMWLKVEGSDRSDHSFVCLFIEIGSHYITPVVLELITYIGLASNSQRSVFQVVGLKVRTTTPGHLRWFLNEELVASKPTT